MNEVRTELQDSASKFLIDYGRGTGLVGLELADLADSVLLVDSSRLMLEVAQAKISRQEIANAEVRHADYTEENPGLNKGGYHFVVTRPSSYSRYEKILKELFQILNEGGKLLSLILTKTIRSATRKSIMVLSIKN